MSTKTEAEMKEASDAFWFNRLNKLERIAKAAAFASVMMDQAAIVGVRNRLGVHGNSWHEAHQELKKALKEFEALKGAI